MTPAHGSRIKRMTAPPDLREFDERIASVRLEKEAAIDAQDFERAAGLRDQEKKLLAQRAEKEQAWKIGDSDMPAEVDEEQIAEVLSSATGIPVFKLTEEESARLLHMEGEYRQADHRPDGRCQGAVAVHSPYARRAQGPEASFRLVHLRWPVRRRGRPS